MEVDVGVSNSSRFEHFESAEDLLKALRRRDPRWQPDPRAWIFRGQANASWPLLPAALRTPTLLTHHPERSGGPYDTLADQVGMLECVGMLEWGQVCS